MSDHIDGPRQIGDPAFSEASGLGNLRTRVLDLGANCFATVDLLLKGHLCNGFAHFQSRPSLSCQGRNTHDRSPNEFRDCRQGQVRPRLK